VSDSILSECVKEIQSELDNIGEDIVHQVCKAEFTVPESPAQEVDVVQEVSQSAADDYSDDEFEPVSRNTLTEGYGDSQQEAVSILRTSEKSYLQPSMDKSKERSQKKGVSFEQNVVEFDKQDQTIDEDGEEKDEDEGSFELDRGAIFDAAELDMADLDTSEQVKDVEKQKVGSVSEEIDYKDDYEDDDDDYEEVSPIDSDEYTTDED